MKSITEELLKLVSDWKGGFTGAFNIREDGGCAGRQSTEHIKIDSAQGVVLYRFGRRIAYKPPPGFLLY